MAIKIADLHPGDLIIWKMGDSDASHVEMFTGASHFGATSIHAVNTPEKGMTRVMATSFSGAFFKHAFRCGDATLVRRAVRQAKRWARFETRYDVPRIQMKTAFRDMHRQLKTASPEMVALLRGQFERSGKYRAIKFAARRRGAMCYPGDEESNGGRGVTCCMFAILCYQTAGLVKFVDKIPSSDVYSRCSDKKMESRDLRNLKKLFKAEGWPMADYEHYAAYCKRLRQKNEFQIDWKQVAKLRGAKTKAIRAEFEKGKPGKKIIGCDYHPSVTYWQNMAAPPTTFDFGDAFTVGMKLDAKLHNPQHLWDSLKDDEANDQNWRYVGQMDKDSVFEDGYKGKVAAYQQRATQRRERYTP